MTTTLVTELTLTLRLTMTVVVVAVAVIIVTAASSDRSINNDVDDPMVFSIR